MHKVLHGEEKGMSSGRGPPGGFGAGEVRWALRWAVRVLLVMVMFAINRRFRHIDQGVVHPSHIPFHPKAQTTYRDWETDRKSVV